MKIYIVYFTIYLGKLLPPFYIGSTSIDKIEKGYHGSVSSAKWKKIWKEEIKNNPQLFKTFIIPNTFRYSKEEITEIEGRWQTIFNVLIDDNFTNQSICYPKFCSTPESVKKGIATKKKRGYRHTEETKEKIRKGNKGKVLTLEQRAYLSEINKGRVQSQETKDKRRRSMMGYKHSEETKEKIRLANLGKPCSEQKRNKLKLHKISDEQKQRLREINLGKKIPKETIDKIQETKRRNGTNKHSEETKQKMRKAKRRTKLKLCRSGC